MNVLKSRDHVRILRSRRDRRKPEGSFFTAVAAAAFCIITVMAGGLFLSLEYAHLSAAHPPIQQVERFLGAPGEGAFKPIQFLDRTGTAVLYRAEHPFAEDRVWLGSSPREAGAQELVRHAVLAANPYAFEMKGLLDFITETGAVRPHRYLSIPEQLLQSTLLRPSAASYDHWLMPLFRYQLLAELQAAYSQDQLFEWYLNSANYGNFAYGFDAAGLVYFGKHADRLSLAEVTILASLPLYPERNPLDNPVDARMMQENVLNNMVASGLITREDARSALTEKLEFRQGIREELSAEFLILWEELEKVVPDAAGRSALEVVTSLDQDLHMQANCLNDEFVRRLGSSSSPPARMCAAAEFLPPIIPTAQGDPSAAAVLQESPFQWILLNPRDGTVLSFGGEIQQEHPLGSAIDPALYLAAYARGKSPASMVLDQFDGQPEGTAIERQSAGLVRMRVALKNGYDGARREVLGQVGPALSVIAQQLGLQLDASSQGFVDVTELLESRSSLMELSRMYMILANDGRQIGAPVEWSGSRMESSGDIAAPVFLLDVEVPGAVLYSLQTAERFVVSRQLAYLVSDSLRRTTPDSFDPRYSGPFWNGEWASHHGTGPGDKSSWVMGYSPDFVIGIRTSASMEDIPTGLPASLPMAAWNALAAYVSETREPGVWVEPPGLVRVDVCDPSGLLPTNDCPVTVSEVFIDGTAPRMYDDLYQTIRINRETGRLATVFTPPSLVEEHTILAWRDDVYSPASGFTPPADFDTIPAAVIDVNSMWITSPDPFSLVSGRVPVEVEIREADLEIIRLQVGEGLDPERWLLLGEQEIDGRQKVRFDPWETNGISGLYTLQVSLLDQDDRISFYSVPIIVDNSPPLLDLDFFAEDGGELTSGEPFVMKASAEDDHGVDRVELYMDGKQIGDWDVPPYELRLTLPAGEYEVTARAQDYAGNEVMVEDVILSVK